jgi:hypothetical protein
MSLPLWDPVAVPPGTTLVDVNSLEPEAHRVAHQALALELWLEETGEPFVERDWNEGEGMFVVVEDATGDIVGITIIVDPE